MDKTEILNSSAFKVLNHMIDEKAEFVRRYLCSFKNTVEWTHDVKYKSYISTRIYDEGSNEIELPLNLEDLKRLHTTLNEVFNCVDEIRKLQSQKCRLLNDYDFTHGDDSEQRKIFG